MVPLVIYEQEGRSNLVSFFGEKKQFSYFPTKNIPDLSGKMILGSHYGWLIGTDYEDHSLVFLFHPFSRIVIDLPRLEELLLSEEIDLERHLKVILTCEPSDQNVDEGRCVLLIAHKSLIMYCRVSYDDNWHFHTARVVVNGVSRRLKDIDSLAVCGGILYGLAVTECLLVKLQFLSRQTDLNLSFSIETAAQFSWKKVTNFQSPRFVATLLEFGSELYWVMVMYGYGDYVNFQDVRVMKFIPNNANGNDGNFDVIDVDDLGNHAFFAGSNNSFGCHIAPSQTKNGLISFGLSEPLLLQKNCVYLMSYDTKAIYVYRLQDRNLSTIRLLANVKTTSTRIFWIQSATQKRFPNRDCKRIINTEEEEEEKASVEVQGITEGLRFGELPSELLGVVARRLQLTDYSRFRSTCKKFRDIASPVACWLDKRAKNEFLESSTSGTVLPWLFFFSRDGKIGNIIDPFHSDEQYSMTTPWGDLFEGKAMDVVYAKDGRLLIYGESGNIFFYNPFSKRMTDVKCPGNQYKDLLRCIGSSGVSDSNGHTIIGLRDFDQLINICSFVYGGDDDAWYVFQTSGVSFMAADNSPVYYKGAFYFLDIRGYMARYKVTHDGRHKWKVLTKPAKPACISASAHMTTYLLECCGELLSVFVDHFGRWVKVFRLDYIRRCWIRVDKLESWMIFVSPHSSFANLAPTTNPEFGNKIYFPRLYRDAVVCYDLQSRTYSLPTGTSIQDHHFC